jgi:hypothetical protein
VFLVEHGVRESGERVRIERREDGRVRAVDLAGSRLARFDPVSGTRAGATPSRRSSGSTDPMRRSRRRRWAAPPRPISRSSGAGSPVCGRRSWPKRRIRDATSCSWRPRRSPPGAAAATAGSRCPPSAPHELAWAAEAADRYARHGYDVKLLDRDAIRAEVDSPTYLGAWWDRSGCVMVDPARLAWGLRRSLAGSACGSTSARL